MRPEALLLQVLLPCFAILARILRDQSLRVLHFDHVVFLLDILVSVFFVALGLQRGLIQAEIGNSWRVLRCVHLVDRANEVLRRHRRPVWVLQGVPLARAGHRCHLNRIVEVVLVLLVVVVLLLALVVIGLVAH